MKKRGFTLTELLIVIAIIAVLVALLMPALAMARRNARMVTCASQQRQVAAAMVSYATDYEGYFPRQDLPGTGANLWDVAIDFYNVLHDRYAVPHQSFFCPFVYDNGDDSFMDAWGYFYIIGYLYWVPRLNGGRQVPPDIGSPDFTIVDTQPFRGPRGIQEMNYLQNPILTDFVSSNNYTPTMNLAVDPGEANSFGEHIWNQTLWAINVAYGDGHVERINGEDVKARYIGNFWNWR